MSHPDHSKEDAESSAEHSLLQEEDLRRSKSTRPRSWAVIQPVLFFVLGVACTVLFNALFKTSPREPVSLVDTPVPSSAYRPCIVSMKSVAERVA